MTEPGLPALRIGDAERDAAEARLHAAVGAGQLTLEEFSQRLTGVLAARTQADLDAILADLPASAPARTRAPAAGGPRRRWIVAVMGGEETAGRWRPAPTTNAIALMGGAEVDLRDAVLDGDEVRLNAVAVMGGVEIVVPEHVAVEVSGFAFMGGREVTVRQPDDPDAPVVRIMAVALMGGVEIRHPGPGDAPRLPAPGRDSAARQRALGAAPAPGQAYAGRGAAPARRADPLPAQGSGSWAGRLVAAAAIAAVTSPFWLPGQAAVAAFGSDRHMVSAVDASDGETVNAATAFGSVTVVVPDGVAVREGGLVLFGSSDCEACGDDAQPDADTVVVCSYGAFGSVNVLTQRQFERRQDQERAEDAREDREDALEDAREDAEDDQDE